MNAQLSFVLVWLVVCHFLMKNEQGSCRGSIFEVTCGAPFLWALLNFNPINLSSRSSAPFPVCYMLAFQPTHWWVVYALWHCRVVLIVCECDENINYSETIGINWLGCIQYVTTPALTPLSSLIHDVFKLGQAKAMNSASFLCIISFLYRLATFEYAFPVMLMLVGMG